MIKFKEHDGMLFKMLEEPVPLKEKDTNVLVRFITQGIIGKYVMEHWLDCNQENVPIFVKDVDSDGDVTVCIENGNEHICCPFPMFEIIGLPVADGSKEWAWYQMMKGEAVTFFGYPNRILKLVNGYIQDSISDGFWNRKSGNEFLNYASSPGWQIYKEPKEEPNLPKEQKIDSGKKEYTCLVCGKKMSELDGMAEVSIKRFSISSLYESTLSHYCGKCFLKLGFDETEKELRNRQQPQVDSEQQHAKEPMADCENCKHVCTNSNIDHCHMYEPKPEPQYKVCDWVEWSEGLGISYQSQITRVSQSAVYSKGICIPLKIITRKLKPSEIIVRIGCLSGTVKDLSYVEDGRFWFIGKKTERCPGGMYAILYDEMLDTETHEIVKNLLKAQNEEK